MTLTRTCVQPDDVLWKKTKTSKKAIAKTRKKRVVPAITEHYITILGGEGWSNVAETVTIHPKLWVEDLPAKLWQLARAGVTGNVLKKDNIEYSPLESSIFYSMLRPLLEDGQQTRVQYKKNQWRKRFFVETDLERIEKLCNFSNFHKTSGFLNLRKAQKKDTIFYNVVIRIEATHTQVFAKPSIGRVETQKAVFKVVVASLNPLATTVFPPDFERSARNMEKLRVYLQSFPVRLHVKGFDVDENLRSICKQLHKKRKKSQANNSEQ